MIDCEVQMSVEVHGWTSPDESTASKYIEKCRLFVTDDIAFSSFRQDPDYRKILEGYDDGGSLWLSEIVSRYGTDELLQYLDGFKKNDVHCSPTIRNLPHVGDICPFTLKYALNAFDIKSVSDGVQYKNIVEVGGGFGSMCIIMDAIYNFESYTIIDLPEVVALVDKYLSLIPEIRSRVNLVPCNDVEKIRSLGPFDLFISDSALAECNSETQQFYLDSLMKKSDHGYIVYNTLRQTESADAFSSLVNQLDVDYAMSGYQMPWVVVLNIKRK